MSDIARRIAYAARYYASENFGRRPKYIILSRDVYHLLHSEYRPFGPLFQLSQDGKTFADMRISIFPVGEETDFMECA
jgi:hypothetical protein